tara:strand:- start:969 stop:2966 length:1998 start_codon:yes stop_codon:yes gene_type:complete
MAKETEKEEKKRLEKERKELSKTSKEDKARGATRARAALLTPKPARALLSPLTRRAGVRVQVARLEQLLSKSIAYSEFLADKIKTEEQGAIKVNDGSVKGPGLPQPKLVTGGEMRPYQLVGVHWLVGLYENGLNGILGDEMGLGKTVQSVALLAHLVSNNVAGPFMVVGPLSTLHNWKNEFTKWAPSLEAVIYHGSKEERAQIRGTMMRGKQSERWPVLITSFEIIIRDAKDLRKIPWKFVIIDEGHRLKNMNCRLIRELKTICDTNVGGNPCNRLLLTGTPLQNNLTELWALLNFLLPSIFDDLESFQAWFDFDFKSESVDEKVLQGEMENSVVTKLHQILRPFLLRRLKADVELSVPKKYEYILFAWLSDWQRSMYTDIKDKALKDSAGKAINAQNVLMQLRKCCNHPYLFEWPVDPATGQESIDEVLVHASGKMQLLDRIMTKLKAQGDHKVLIFSQMTRMLDILEDYLTLRGYKFRRLDGSVSATDRMHAMNEFNSDKSIDAFLLSTRAGGLGINLVAADTCIIFDSDWNPHADLQAQDRCHRIGQTKTVIVYRLSTADTVEDKILEAAKQKLKLEQLVVSKGKFKDIGAKTDKNEQLKVGELKDLLAFDPSKTALGKKNKVITEEELEIVLDREGGEKEGRGFMAVQKVTNSFDALNSKQ